MILEEFDMEQHIRSERKTYYEMGLSEGRAAGLSQGRAEGLSQGETKALVRQVCRKLQKGNTPGAIAEALDESLESVLPICEAAKAFAPEYDADEVFEALMKR